MSQFFKTIQDKTNPAVHNRRDFSTVAKVISSDQINNVCSIEFIDKSGYKSNKDNVPVKIYVPGFIGWFPKSGDLVNIDTESDAYIITSAYESGYASNHRPGNQLKKDIYSGASGGPVGGTIV